MIKTQASLALAWALVAGDAPALAASAHAIPRASCAGWGHRGVIVMTGSTAGGGLDGKVSRTVDPASGRWSERTDYGSMSVASGYDGAFGWSRDRSGGAHSLDSDFARRVAVSEAWVARRGWCQAHAGGAEVEAAAAEGGFSVWKVRPRGGAPIELWTDHASGLPYKVVEQLSENRLIRTYSQWTSLPDGAWVARVERVDDPEDEAGETLKFDSVERRQGSPAVFAPPPPPRDGQILGGRPSATVPYEADVDRIFVPVFVDGHGPMMFELDTGGHLILTADAANGLKLDPVGSFSSTGGGQGIAKAGFVRIHQLRIGEAVLPEQPAKVLNLSAASNDRGPRPPRAGILGLELFERFAVHLDRRAHTLTLTPLETYRHSGHGVALPLRFTEDAPQTRGAVAGIAGDLELDSGNSGPAIVEGRWATDHGLADRFSSGVVASGSGVGGDYKEVVSHARLKLGPFDLPGELVSYVGVVERGSESMRDIAGNLGEPILAQFNVTFDYRRHQVWLDPLPGRAPRAYNRAGLGLSKVGEAPFKVGLVIPGSPAERAGIHVGDLVRAVDGRPASAMAAFEARERFLQPAGSVVTLTVQPAAGGAHEVRLTLADLAP
jgi:hypothetical protein